MAFGDGRRVSNGMEKKFIVISLLLTLQLLPTFALAARFGWGSGGPVIMEDGTVSTNDNLEQSRKAWVLGQPGIIFDATAVELTPTITQLHYRWREDNGTESTATYAAAEDTALTANIFIGDRRRLRILVSNTGSGSATGITYRLEHASSSCTTWLAVPSTSALLSEHFAMDLSSNVADGTNTTDSSGLSNPAGTFVAGQVKTLSNETSGITLAGSNTNFTELEYSVKSTGFVTPSTTYCFRLTNAGATTNFSYLVQPQLSISASGRLQGGGSSSGEGSGTGSQQSGGGSSGGSGSEGGGVVTPPVSGGGAGGGGSVE